MKIIAVSQKADEYPDRNEVRDALDQQMAGFVESCNAILFPIPNYFSSDNVLLQWLGYLSPDGIILSGGEDIGTNLKRDAIEETLLTYSEDLRLPLLGICRGTQMIGARAGSKIKKVTGHVALHHHIKGEINGKVNSFHNNALADKPKNFSIIARSIDNEIEAIRHDYLPWEGWMWHPEREKTFLMRDINRFKALLS